MELKNGNVKLLGVRPELLFGLTIIDTLHTNMFGFNMVITSVAESTAKHSKTSLHYSGCAADIRIRTMPPHLINKFHEMAIARLGSEFDLVHEDNHFHLEFQPKNL